MTGAPLAPVLPAQIVRLLLLHCRPDVVAGVVHCSHTIVYKIQENSFSCSISFQKDGFQRLIKAVGFFFGSPPWGTAMNSTEGDDMMFMRRVKTE